MRENRVLVLGGGPGGYVAAIRAAQLGARVTLVEADQVGGTCMNRGCIPTKALLQATSYLDDFQKARAYGLDFGSPSIDFKKMMSRKRQILKTLVRGVKDLLRQHHVHVVEGYGRLISEREIEVEDPEGKKNTVSADRLILATGSGTQRPPIPGLDLPGVMDSDQALDIESPPRSLLIIGGGYIGLEFAVIYSRLGSKVLVVEMEPHILPAEDEEISRALEESLAERGIEILTGSRIREIKPSGPNLEVCLAGQKSPSRIVDKVLLAAGRAPRLDEQVLHRVGLQRTAQGIVVSDRLETSIPHVYAIGDMIGGYLLAHVAYAEGAAAAENALGANCVLDYTAVPRCIFTSPEVASVGMTEKKAKEIHPEVRVGRFPFQYNGKALIEGERHGLVKVVTEPRSGEILGVHILGPHASELLAEATTVISLEGRIEDMQAIIHPHPTLNEALGEAAMDVEKRAFHVSPQKRRQKSA